MYSLNSLTHTREARFHMKNYKDSVEKKWYQQGVPTKVFLERCLSPVSNIHADTPKSAILTEPLASSKIFPACIVKNVWKRIKRGHNEYKHVEKRRIKIHRNKKKLILGFRYSLTSSTKQKLSSFKIIQSHYPPSL